MVCSCDGLLILRLTLSRRRLEEERLAKEEEERKAKEEERQRRIEAGEEVSDEGEHRAGSTELGLELVKSVLNSQCTAILFCTASF